MSSVQITNGNVNAEVDSLTSALTGICVEHKRIHEGNHYSVSYFFDGIADSGTTELLLKTTNCTLLPHLTGMVQSNLAGKIEFFENVTLTADGTALTALNNHRASTNTPSCTIYHTPTAATGGSILFRSALFGGGKNEGGNSVREKEFILATNQKYLLRFTSWAASNTCNMILDFYVA